MFGRQPEDSYENWKNRSIEPVEWEIRYDTYPIGIFGLLLNTFIIWITFTSEKIVGNYKYFVANLALCDLGLCLASLSYSTYMAFIYHTNRKLTVVSCTLIYGPIFGMAMSMILACNLIIINRYVVLVREKDHLFTNRVIILACLFTYFPTISLLLNLAFGEHITEHPGPCKVMLWTEFPSEAILGSVVLAFYTMGFYCSGKIYLKLYKHYAEVGSSFRNQRMVTNPSDTVNEKSILRAVVIQATLPILMTTPAMVLLIIALKQRRYGDVNKWVLYENSWIRFDARTIGDTLVIANPISDALVSILVMRQYRRAAKHVFVKMSDYLCRVRRSEETAVIHLEARQPTVSHFVHTRHTKIITSA